MNRALVLGVPPDRKTLDAELTTLMIALSVHVEGTK